MLCTLLLLHATIFKYFKDILHHDKLCICHRMLVVLQQSPWFTLSPCLCWETNNTTSMIPPIHQSMIVTDHDPSEFIHHSGAMTRRCQSFSLSQLYSGLLRLEAVITLETLSLKCQNWHFKWIKVEVEEAKTYKQIWKKNAANTKLHELPKQPQTSQLNRSSPGH